MSEKSEEKRPTARPWEAILWEEAGPNEFHTWRVLQSDTKLNGRHVIARCYGPDAEANAKLIASACNAMQRARYGLDEVLAKRAAEKAK